MYILQSKAAFSFKPAYSRICFFLISRGVLCGSSDKCKIGSGNETCNESAGCTVQAEEVLSDEEALLSL